MTSEQLQQQSAAAATIITDIDQFNPANLQVVTSYSIKAGVKIAQVIYNNNEGILLASHVPIRVFAGIKQGKFQRSTNKQYMGLNVKDMPAEFVHLLGTIRQAIYDKVAQTYHGKFNMNKLFKTVTQKGDGTKHEMIYVHLEDNFELFDESRTLIAHPTYIRIKGEKM
jgi:hypothetical protein